MGKNQPQKVVFISYYFPPLGMGGTQRAAKFAKYLPAFGWKPVVVTVKDVYYYAHDYSLLEEIGHVPIFRTESLDPLRLIARLKKVKPSSTGESTTRSSKSQFNTINNLIGGWLFIPDTKILWLPFAVLTSLRLIRRERIHIIFSTSPPHSAHLAGLFLKMITSIKWVADFRDDWTGGESQPCPSAAHAIINRFLEKIVLKTADHVIGMCDHLTSVLKQKSGTSTDKFSTIMNGYDRHDFSSLLDTPLENTFTITHCGSISKVSNPESFLEAIKSLFDEMPELKTKINVQFIGTDIYDDFQRILEKFDLQHVIQSIHYVPHDEALKKIMASHVLLLTILKKTDEEIITGKVFEYLASGKPILMISSNGYVSRLVQNLQRGIVIPDHDREGIKNAVLHYWRLFQNGRLFVNEPLSVPQFDRENLTGELATIFNKLFVNEK